MRCCEQRNCEIMFDWIWVQKQKKIKKKFSSFGGQEKLGGLRKLGTVTDWKSGPNMLQSNINRRASGEIQSVTGKTDV